MATAAVGITGATAIPYVGWIIAIAAAYVDATYIAPSLAGKGREAARSPRLLDVPVGSNEPGAPRVWAIGRRVRVPTHVLWQDRKVRESTSGGNKGGTSVQLRRVYIDALISLNDRRTLSLQQLVGNGALLLYKSRNLVEIVTSNMRADYDAGGPSIVLQVSSTLDPSFTDRFQVDDIVKFTDWVHEGGADELNTGFWKVDAVTDHAPGTPSTMSVIPQSGQSITSSAYNAGNEYAPAKVERVDDAVVDPGTWAISSIGPSLIFVSDAMEDVFFAGDRVRIQGVKLSPGVGSIPSDAVYQYNGTNGPTPTAGFTRVGGTSDPPSGNYVNVSGTEVLQITAVQARLYTAGIFPPTFNPGANYHNGADDQGEDSLLAAANGTGNIPAYRGVAYQGLDSFFATRFGDQLPYSLEALLEIDPAMSWAQAVSEVLQRADIPVTAIDTSGVSTRPFGGMFLRGAVPTLTAIQPMLVAGQIIGQERDGIIAMFHVDNADVVQVENGASFSDFATIGSRDPRTDNKVIVEDQAEEDLPTSVGIRHQDPDNQYADGYQHFGLRNPQGVAHQNEQELDLSNVVLTRKEARNLATTVMRRAWINRRKYRFTLPVAYMHVLENDILTFTTDEDDIVRCRVIQRDMGSDFRVSVVALAEDVDLDVSGSPVQSGAGITSPSVITPAYVIAITLDIPAIEDSGIIPPRLRFALCAANFGENWAGAQVWESIDGASYTNVGSVSEQTAIGYFDTDLTSQTASEEYGTTTVTVRSQTVDVQLWYEGSTAIEAATQAEAEAGKNWVAIISNAGTADDAVEIAAFTTVTPNGSGSYTLGGWLRGLRGTASVQRDTGSVIVLLTPGDALFDREFPGQVTPTSLEYKVVPLGADIDDVTAIVVEATWRNSRPLPVRSITKTIGASPFDVRFDIEANWTRALLPPGTQPPHPIDEPFEEYRLDIYDPNGVTLMRQKTITSTGTGSSTIRDRWFDYPAAEQTTDGYTPSGTETFVIDCVQVGEYGEGPSTLQEL